MTDLVAVLRGEHRRILAANEVMRARYHAYPFDPARARRAVHRLVRVEAGHEVAEACFLWPLVRDLLPEYRQMREEAAAEEKELARWLRQLHKSSGTASSVALAEKVSRAVVSHIGMEEGQILPSLDAVISRYDSARLGRHYAEFSARTPSRPHPRLPAVPGLIALSGPLVGRVDRILDRLRVR